MSGLALSLSLSLSLFQPGGWGIHLAQQLNPCARNNDTLECVRDLALDPTLTAANTSEEMYVHVCAGEEVS